VSAVIYIYIYIQLKNKMEESMHIPENVRFMSKKMAGYSRNRSKVMPLGARTANGGTTTHWALPENALIDTSSIRVHANIATSGATVSAQWGDCLSMAN
jgi:hypothetical protein